ncbi:MAG TPA: hypothetical protein PKA05_23255 [Roseiflexaceae bacterium]|nr:hypothetical protein [Roseiflexaceae bacterium]HMP43311.1 hypothetical protein [Roseiflexaceae bacterium]
MQISEDFDTSLAGHWRTMQTPAALLAIDGEGLQLAIGGCDGRQYANAQIDDYSGLPRTAFPWRPPLRLMVRAAASTQIAGTAGFGFWNSPISPVGKVLPVLPAAIWFMHAAPPADMPLAAGVAGHGWKAACIDSGRPQAWPWAPLAPAVLLANRISAVEQRLWPRVQQALGISEALITPPDATIREYVIEWSIGRARFLIDNHVVHEASTAPRGPLGFVAWIDNQWLVATPRGSFAWGLHAVPAAQWLRIQHIEIVPSAAG